MASFLLVNAAKNRENYSKLEATSRKHKNVSFTKKKKPVLYICIYWRVCSGVHLTFYTLYDELYVCAFIYIYIYIYI